MSRMPKLALGVVTSPLGRRTVPLTLGVLLAAHASSAQVALRDADVPAAVRLLRAEIAENRRQAEEDRRTMADYTATARRLEAQMNLESELKRELTAGRLDPLEWLRQRATTIPVPPGAQYDVSCSKVSVADNSTVALFTFGREAAPGQTRGALRRAPSDSSQDAAILRGLLAQAVGQQHVEDALTRLDVTSAGREDMESIAPVVAFYKANGFEPAPFESRTEVAKLILLSANRARDSLQVFVANYNTYAKHVPACRAFPSGMFVAVRLIDPRYQRVLDPVWIDGVRAELRMTEDRVHALRDAVATARSDAGGENEQNLAEMERGDGTLRATGVTRRQNAAWYRRHAGTLDPLFAELQRAQQR